MQGVRLEVKQFCERGLTRNVPSRAVTRGLAGFLFFKFRFRVKQEFTDYKRVATRVHDEED